MGPTPGKVTVMRADGLKEGRRSGTRSELLKWSSVALMPIVVLQMGWALANRPRKERANAVVRRSIVRLRCTYCRCGDPSFITGSMLSVHCESAQGRELLRITVNKNKQQELDAKNTFDVGTHGVMVCRP